MSLLPNYRCRRQRWRGTERGEFLQRTVESEASTTASDEQIRLRMAV